MSVNIIKVTETYLKSSRIVITKEIVIASADNYREALDIVRDLELKNTKPSVSYKTGNINQ
jgi:hypothetical protein